MPGFKEAIVTGKAMGVMCSYNMLNGKPTCGNPALTKTLRDDWSFDGYITSDTDACGDIYKSHHYASDGQHATADCLAGGTDINSGGTYHENLAPGIASGVVPLSDAQAALHNAYRFRMRLGLFDANSTSANRKIGTEVIGSAEHKAAALEAARQSMVLLKNDPDRGLPFTPGKHLVVVGNDVGNILATMGNYNGNNICPASVDSERGSGINTDCLKSYWDALNATNAAAGGTAALLTSGGDKGTVKTWDKETIAAAVALAGKADNLLVFISNAFDEGSEGRDRSSIALADDQAAMAAAVLAAAPHAAHVALVLINGDVIAIDSLRDAAPAILDTFMPGVYGAQAVDETIWGQNVPGGKLPSTFYFSNYTDGCDIDDMSMQACGGRTYRYWTGPVLYPFGHGLSYTTFSLQWSPQPPPGNKAARFTSLAGSASYTVVVTNTGKKYAADEVVLAFFKPDASSIRSLAGTPVVTKQLFSFQRIHLAPGESQTLKFTVNSTTLGLADSEGHLSLHPGQYSVVFSRGCVGCDELETGVVVDASQPLRIATHRAL